MSLMADFESVLADDPIDLARAALLIARIEYPTLEPAPSLDVLDRFGERAAVRVASSTSVRDRVAILNSFLFVEERFSGNLERYADFRNSLLNVVLGRRLGIPITLALVYMEVARRAGIEVRGVAFPGHFLLRVALGVREQFSAEALRLPMARALPALIIDPFNGGAEMDAAACQRLLGSHLGELGDELPFDRALLNPCSPRQMLARMLNNLKRTYVEMRSFPQAKAATDLLLAIDPMLHVERRDRGLLAYHLDDYASALRDLEDYLRLHGWSTAKRERSEHDQIWEHVKNLRRRVAGLN
jgi:regulator of sirC expression with transglutaminase-like and TPR domain